MKDRLVIVWREGPDVVYEIAPGGPDERFIRDYFHLDVDLRAVYADFARADGHLGHAIERFMGLRVLRQDPEETLLSYICSAANSVPRISTAVEAMSARLGHRIASLDGRDYYSFPTAHAIAEAGAECIAGVCNLGFRCGNIVSVARQILDRPAGWLDSLRDASYGEARSELLSIRGVGMKIADCVLLFALDKHEAVPVDTHIRQVAVKYYMSDMKQKTLTPAVYERIVSLFQERFGPFAGWAQEYLFYDDLIKD